MQTERGGPLAPMSIPRKQNELADQCSRWANKDGWPLHNKYFEWLDWLWGKQTVDRFAIKDNIQGLSYCFPQPKQSRRCICTATWQQLGLSTILFDSRSSEALSDEIKAKACTSTVPDRPSVSYFRCLIKSPPVSTMSEGFIQHTIKAMPFDIAPRFLFLFTSSSGKE